MKKRIWKKLFYILTIIILTTSLSGSKYVEKVRNNDTEDNLPYLFQDGWNTTYGGTEYDLLYCVKETTDGGYIAVGVTTQSGVEYAWVIKIDEKGNIEWESKEIPSSVESFSYYVQQTSDGGYIVSGYTKTSIYDYEGFLWKMDKNGKTEWIKRYKDFYSLYKVQQCNDGYIIVGTIIIDLDANDCDAVLAKTDRDGNIEWEKIYRHGSGWDGARALTVTQDKGYIMGGVAWNPSKSGDYWIIKTDADGNKQWDKCYGNSEWEGIWSRDCFQTPDGGYIFCGYTSSYGTGKIDAWVIKTDANGNLEWNKTYGGEENDLCWSIGIASDNGYLICITKNYGIYFQTGDIWIVKIDDKGNILWSQTFGGTKEDRGYYVTETSDGGYIVAGRTNSFGAGDSDGWLIKVTNVPPNKPERPSGPSSGKIKTKYTYTTSSIDLNGDEVYYMWDWGDNTTSDWLGPFPSGKVADAEHTWNKEGDYVIRVKAKDSYGHESPWSDQLSVSMPKSYKNPLVALIQKINEWFISTFGRELLPRFL